MFVSSAIELHMTFPSSDTYYRSLIMLHARVCILFIFPFTKENYNFGENLKYVPVQKRWQLSNIKNYLTLKVQDEYLKHLPRLFCFKSPPFFSRAKNSTK